MVAKIADRSWRSRLKSCAWLACAILIAVAVRVAPVSAQGTPQAADPPPLSPQQLEQIVAPIALYPDDLLSQVLMASTYPLEVVQAARWTSQNPNMTGKALEDAMAKQTWDPSVKALAAVPQTLQMMSDKLDWTAATRRCLSRRSGRGARCGSASAQARGRHRQSEDVAAAEGHRTFRARARPASRPNTSWSSPPIRK